MTEELVDAGQQPVAWQRPPLTHAEVLRRYAQTPDANAHLLGHMRRLVDSEAAQESVAVHLPVESTDTDSGGGVRSSIEAELQDEGAISGRSVEEARKPQLSDIMYHYREALATARPEDLWRLRYEAFTVPGYILKRGDYAAEELDSFLDEAMMLSNELTERYSQDMPSVPREANYLRLIWLLRDYAPSDKVQSIYRPKHGEDSRLSAMLQDTLSIDGDEVSLHAVAGLAPRLFGQASWLDIVADPDVMSINQGFNYTPDPVLRLLFPRKSIAECVLEELETTNGYHAGAAATSEEASTAKWDWGDKFLERVVGLPDGIRDEWGFAAYSRLLVQGSTLVDTPLLEYSLRKIAILAERFGIDGINRLREGAGIVNLDYFSPEELESTLGVIDNDDQEIERLKEHDVTVVLSDARGDYNGAQSNDADVFRGSEGNTLFFGVNQPSDFYRYLVMLKKIGVRPSTLVLESHGVPGIMGFGQAGGFQLVSAASANKPHAIPVVNAKALPRLVGEYMQDSRGIDDNPEARGRRRIIVKSCSAARSVDTLRARLLGKRESTAGSLAKTIDNPNVDLYAAKQLMSINRTNTGMTFNEHTLKPHGEETRKPQVVTHLFVDTSGNLIETNMEEVALYNASVG